MRKIEKLSVYCKHCQESKEVGRFKPINIEEDIQGMDIVTFKCPDCKTTQKSYIRGH